MRLFKVKTSKSVLLIVTVLCLTGCLGGSDGQSPLPASPDPGRSLTPPAKSPGVENNANGTSDGGGTFIPTSTPEQIKEAVEKVRTLMLQDKIRDRFFQIVDYNGSYDDPEVFVYTGRRGAIYLDPLNMIFYPKKTLWDQLIDLVLMLNGQDVYGLDDIDFESEQEMKDWEVYEEWKASRDAPEALKDYLPNLEVFYEETGPCKHSGDYEADASVTDYNRQAKVCFSIERLKRIPPTGLVPHIFGLWIHELTHMGGEVNEKKADEFEEVAILYFKEILFGEVDLLNSVYRHVSQIFYDMEGKVENLVGILEDAAADPTVDEARKKKIADTVLFTFGEIANSNRILVEFLSTTGPDSIFGSVLDDDQGDKVFLNVRALEWQFNDVRSGRPEPENILDPDFLKKLKDYEEQVDKAGSDFSDQIYMILTNRPKSTD